MKVSSKNEMTHNPPEEVHWVSCLRENFTSSSDGEGLETGLAKVPRQPFTLQKVYDELKSKLSEKKAWAQGNTARNMQALLTCLSYNLMYLLQQTLAKEENLTDNKETSRRNKRLEQLKQKLKEQGGILPLPQQVPHKPTQIGQKFIRWLRNHCWKQTSYAHAIDALRLKYT